MTKPGSISSEHQIQQLGVFVHGALAFGHSLGIFYNLRRKNWFDVAMHTAATAYDLWAVSKHMRDSHDHGLDKWAYGSGQGTLAGDDDL